MESFLALPHFIAGTNRLGMLQSGLAASVAHMPGIRLLELPFEAIPVVSALWWHPVHTRDPEHVWMRGIFEEAARILAKEPDPFPAVDA